MSEIDVTYCKFARINDVCASPINKQECKCSKIPIQMCYYKQLQQLKQENEKLRFPREDIDFAVLTKEEFENYNKLKNILDEIFENIEYIEATAERIDDDNYIALAYRIAETSRNILQLIKQAKEGE